MFNSFMVKFTASFISFILALGTFFGAYKAPKTEDASKYFDGNIKNVIYLIGDGMGFNHLEKTKVERNTKLGDLINKRLEACGEFESVYLPVAKTCMVIDSLTKPTVVHNEKFATYIGSYLSKLLLTQ